MIPGRRLRVAKSKRSARRKDRKGRVLAWLAALLSGWAAKLSIPLIMLGVGIGVNSYWHRPQLSISVAKALVGSNRAHDGTGLHEYRAVYDLQLQCLTAGIDFAASDDDMPDLRRRAPPRVAYGVLLENLGRTELNDIRMTFRSRDDSFDVTASPQLAVTQTIQHDPEGLVLRTVTIAAMAPGAKGVLLAALPIPDARITLGGVSQDKYKMDYSLGNEHAMLSNQVLFAGARQLSTAPIHIATMDDVLTRQKETFGLEGISLPIEPVELSWRGGTRASFKPPFSTCPSAPRCRCYDVKFVQLGKPSDPAPSPRSDTKP